MNDVSAVQKHTCAACGAPAEWNAAKLRLVCPFCGTETPFEMKPATGQIERSIWPARCATSTTPSAVEGRQEDRPVPGCKCRSSTPTGSASGATSAARPRSSTTTRSRPRSARRACCRSACRRAASAETIRKWYAGRWFAPNALSKKALVDTIKGIYIPYWTFDARVHCPWTAEAGHYYYETERRNGKTERVRKVRWEPASGVVDHFFDDTWSRHARRP
jgi:hypothetical protein